MLEAGAGCVLDSSRADEVPSDRPEERSLWRRADRVLWRLVLDDVVLLPEDGDGEPFALSGGRELWEALSERRRLDQVAELLSAKDSSQELLELLYSLVDRGAVERFGA